MLQLLAALIVAMCVTPGFVSAIPAFPGAQGAGAVSTGGRGGSVIIVSNLADSGTGSLRACMQASGPRTCIFRVAGTIQILSGIGISSGNLTVAGQTAPGGGILLSGKNETQTMITINASNVVLRYLRVRKGDSSCSGECGGNIRVSSGSNVMLDHISSTWNEDEGIAVTGYAPSLVSNVTMSYILTAEGLVPHATGALFVGDGGGADGKGYDMHHSVNMNNSHRNPLILNPETRFVNNINYNNELRGIQISARGSFTVTADIIGNLFKKGPTYGVYNAYEIAPTTDGRSVFPTMYLSLNKGFHQTDPNGDQWAMCRQDAGDNNPFIAGPCPASVKRFSPLPALPIPIVPDPVAQVESPSGVVIPTVGASRRLDCNGNWVANRDSVDVRLINQLINNTGVSTLPSSETQVGGFPVIATGTPCADADLDGMPDVWETANGLNPNNAADRNGVSASGFTNLEVYLAGPSAVSTSPTVSLTAPAAGATVSGSSVTVSANANDDVAVLGVQFMLDDSPLGAEDTSAPYSITWNSTTATDGTHTLSATARDASTSVNSGNQAVVVNNAAPDTTPPTVSFTAPANGAIVSGPAVTLSANASDGVGVAGVQFGYGATNIGAEDTTAPYSVSWDTSLLVNGSKSLFARARDASGNTQTATETVTTSNTAVTSFTIGETSLLPIQDSGNANFLIAVKYNLPQTATIQSMSFYTTTSNGSLRLGIYDSTGPGGGPGSKKAETPEITPAVNSFNTTNVNVPVSLTAGDYWLAYLPSDNALGFKYQTTGGTESKFQFPYAPLPATFSTTTIDATGRWTLYATFTVPTGDTTPPTVSLTAPAAGAVLSGPVSVSANASDDVAVAGVQFKLDGANLGAEDTTPPYAVTWNTPTATDGIHSITAVARDTGNNTTTSAARSVTVNNTEICP